MFSPKVQEGRAMELEEEAVTNTNYSAAASA